MKSLLRFLMPRGIGGQIVLLLFATLLLSQAVTLALVVITDAQRNPPDASLRPQLRAISAVIRMIADTETKADRQVIIDAANRSNPDIDVRMIDRPGGSIPPSDAVSGPGFIQRDLGPSFDVDIDPRSDDRTAPRPIYVTLPDGGFLRATLPYIQPPAAPLNPRINIVLFAALGIVALLIWATRVLSTRLRNFAHAVADFSPEGDHDPLPETGPTEIATVANALNRMRDRIAALVKTRTMMLSAVGHDLRTPVTRLRLRSEFIDDPDIRAAMLRDLDNMTAMINAVLALLRDPNALAPRERIDLAGLLMTIADDFTDTGSPVAYSGPDHCPATLRPDDIRRAITNLAENALRYGSKAEITLSDAAPDAIHLTVEDDGPGIPEADREMMLQPFMRGDPTRAADEDNFGLGLSIANSIVASHGGTLALGDSPLGGLKVSITLPR